MEEIPDIYQALLDGNPDGVWPIWLVWRGPLILWGLRFAKGRRDLVEDAVADTFLAMRGHVGGSVGIVGAAGAGSSAGAGGTAGAGSAAGTAGSFNDVGHIQAWMHDTVRNKCWSALRKQRQLVTPAAGSGDAAAAEFSSDLAASQSIDIKDSEIMTRQIVRLIVEKLNTMPRKRSRDCYAHLFHGKSIAQIAKDRGVSRPSVAKNVEIGLRAVQKYLIDMGLNF